MILREYYMISKFNVLPKLVESDHCPINFHILNSNLKESSSAEMNIRVNDSSPCYDVYLWQDEKITKHLFEMNRHVLRLKKCCVPQLKVVVAIIYVIFSMVC